jgi:hypothetical protein
MAAPPSAVIDSTPVDAATAARFEAAEAVAWADCYAAAPAAFAAGAGLSTRWVGDALVLSWAASDRRYFSRAIGLGVVEPASPAAIDDILDRHIRAGISMFLLQSMPHCRPTEYEAWLRERGLELFDAHDRVARGGQPPGVTPPRGDRRLAVELVGRDEAEEWSDYLQGVYGLNTGPWLPELIGRPGWHQFVAREGLRIVGARGMYIGPGGIAWMGMDAPVPGLMTNDYEPDAAICEAMVTHGLEQGAVAFIADIEAPSDAMDTPPYEYFGRLGFTRPYVRTHWAHVE